MDEQTDEATRHHAGHSEHTKGSDHNGHSAHDGHAGHDGHEAHAGHDEHDGHEGHAGHDPGLFKRKFWLSLALTIPTLVFSQGLQQILGLDGPRFPGSAYIPAVFGVVLFFYGGTVFLRGAVAELRSRQPGMMTLISLAIVVAFGYSLAVTLGLGGMDFWWELATLITIMLLGHWIEMSAVMGAQDALGELARLLPDTAERLSSVQGEGIQATEIVPVRELAVGDRIVVRPGSSIPADGVVVDGRSDVDESLLTGESKPVSRSVGSSVVAGSISGSGALTLRVSRVGADTALAGIMKLVSDAQASKSRTQILADKAAGWLFYVALGAAFVTLVVWAILTPGDPSFILERVVTVLIIACPHALGLAIPLVAQISTSIGARNGLLIRDRHAMEDARLLDVILFDKTGTLTEGRQGVTEVIPAQGSTAHEVARLAAAVESSSEHPIGRAIVAHARDAGITIPVVREFGSTAGVGVRASVDGVEVEVGSPRIVDERPVRPDPTLAESARTASARGETVVYVVAGPAVIGLIAISDVIRVESADAVAELQGHGIRVAMLTGDSADVAAAVGARLGITKIFSEVLPGDKSRVVAELQRSGARVGMVGDGVNDAPALTQSDVGIAIGAGTDVAIESAGIVLASSNPAGVASVIALSRATYRKMKQNLAWATGYNVIAIPLAAGVASGVGFVVSPAFGAVLMSVSTIVVALNAQLLRRLKL